MKKNKTIISIVMGSDSDLPVMKEAVDILNEFDISFETLILSAHRSPDETTKFSKAATARGIKVIIAAAGGAAHLPGMIAAITILPVIGVPVQSKTMSGIDSLYSIVQMPPGVPVATVAINGAKNAGILALQILAISDKSLQAKLNLFKKNLQNEVVAKAHSLEKLGYKKYLLKRKL